MGKKEVKKAIISIIIIAFTLLSTIVIPTGDASEGYFMILRPSDNETVSDTTTIRMKSEPAQYSVNINIHDYNKPVDSLVKEIRDVELTNPPNIFEYDWDTTDFGDGRYTIKAGNAKGYFFNVDVFVNNNNNRPNKPTPIGTWPTEGSYQNTYTFTAQANNPNNKNIRYYWYYGSDESWNTITSGTLSSGTPHSVDIRFKTTGFKIIRVWAVDIDGNIGDFYRHDISITNQPIDPDLKRVYVGDGPAYFNIQVGNDHTRYLSLKNYDPSDGGVTVSVDSEYSSYVKIIDIGKWENGILNWGYDKATFNDVDDQYRVKLKGLQLTDSLPNKRVTITFNVDNSEYEKAVIYAQVIHGGSGGGNGYILRAFADGPYHTPDAAMPVEFTGRARGPGPSSQGKPVYYRWDFTGNGEWDTEWIKVTSNSLNVNLPPYEYTYSSNGIYTAKLEVRRQYCDPYCSWYYGTDTAEVIVGEEYHDPPDGDFSWKITNFGMDNWMGRPYIWWDLKCTPKSLSPLVSSTAFKFTPIGNKENVPDYCPYSTPWNRWGSGSINYKYYEDCLDENVGVWVKVQMKITDIFGYQTIVSKNIKLWPITQDDLPTIVEIPIIEVNQYVKTATDSSWKKHHVNVVADEKLSFKIEYIHRGVIENTITPEISIKLSDNIRDIHNGKITKLNANGYPVSHPSFKRSFQHYEYSNWDWEVDAYLDRLEYASYLQEGKIDPVLRNAFNSHPKLYVTSDAELVKASSFSPWPKFQKPDHWFIIDKMETPVTNPMGYFGYVIDARDQSSGGYLDPWMRVYKLDNIYPEELYYPPDHPIFIDDDMNLKPGEKLIIEFDVDTYCFKDHKLIDQLQINGQVVPIDIIKDYGLPENTNAGVRTTASGEVDGVYIVGSWIPPQIYDPDWADLVFEWLTLGDLAYSTASIVPFKPFMQVADPKLPEPYNWVDSTSVDACDMVEFKAVVRNRDGFSFEDGLKVFVEENENMLYINTEYVKLRAYDHSGNLVESKETTNYFFEIYKGQLIWRIEDGFIEYTNYRLGEKVIIFSEVEIKYNAKAIGIDPGSNPISSLSCNLNTLELVDFEMLNILYTGYSGGDSSGAAIKNFNRFEWNNIKIQDGAHVFVEGYCDDDNGDGYDDSLKAMDILVETQINTPVTIDLLNHVIGATYLTVIEIVSMPINGEISEKDFVDGEVIYTPDADFVGSDSFTYIAIDEKLGESNEATVEIRVLDENGDDDDNGDEYNATLEIKKPVPNRLYLRNLFDIPFIGTIILGKIDVDVTLNDPSNEVSELVFYIDGSLLSRVEVNPDVKDYSFYWNQRAFGLKTIEIVAYNENDEVITSSEIDVLAFII